MVDSKCLFDSQIQEVDGNSGIIFIDRRAVSKVVRLYLLDYVIQLFILRRWGLFWFGFSFCHLVTEIFLSVIKFKQIDLQKKSLMLSYKVIQVKMCHAKEEDYGKDF